MRKATKIFLAFIVVIALLLSAVFAIAKMKNNSEKISIIATNFPAYDFVRAVAGDKANIKMLVKPGSEIHNFEPTPQDIIDINNSKLFVYTGGESDEWIEDILSDVDADKTKLFKMMDAVEVVEEEAVEGMESEEEEEEGEEPEYDEHVWTSVRNATKIVNEIKNELVEISPENKNIFESKAKNYIEQLNDIDKKFQSVVGHANTKTLIFGDRFPLRYFVEDYGLKYYAAFPGCSDQTEASSKTIAFLVNKVKANSNKVVLKIEMSSGKIAETIANETGAKVLTFNSAHNISMDEFNSGLTYVTIMKNNVKVLEEALK
jgi:zinc transport system substrate-binding protein